MLASAAAFTLPPAIVRIYFAFAGWQFDIGQTILAVPELGRD
jgi:hypothetical protein